MITRSEIEWREQNAERILRIYERVAERPELDIEPESMVADLLHDLHFWCDSVGVEWKSALEWERSFYDDAKG